MLKKNVLQSVTTNGGHSSGSSSVGFRDRSGVPSSFFFTIRIEDGEEDSIFLKDPERGARTYLDTNGEVQYAEQPEYCLVTLCAQDGTILESEVRGEWFERTLKFFTSWWNKRRTPVRKIKRGNEEILQPLASLEVSGSALSAIDNLGSIEEFYHFVSDNNVVMEFKKGQPFTTEDRFAPKVEGDNTPKVRTDWVPTISILEGVTAHKIDHTPATHTANNL